MLLKDYLKKKNLTQEAFASSVGVTGTLINRLISGKRTPSFKLAKKIQKTTDGLVTINDFPMEPKNK